MSPFAAKFKLIFIPFLVITAGTICTYTFLNWLLIIKLKAFQVDEEVVNFFIPAGLIFIPLIIWLRPRLKLLKLVAKGRSDPLLGLIILAGIITGVPMLITQAYIVTATGKLTRLDNIRQINNTPETKYYTVKQFYINKTLAHVKNVFVVTGKKHTDFDMYIYACVPVFDHLFPDTNVIAAMRNHVNAKALIILNGQLSTMQQLKKLPADSISMMRYLNPSFVMPKYGDTGKYGAIAVATKGYKIKATLPPLKMSPVAWLAIKYSKTVSNSLSADEKQKRFNEFAMASNIDFVHKHLEKFVYLSRLPYNKDLRNYIASVKSRDDIVENDEPVILSPAYDSFANRNGKKLVWIFASFTIGSVIFLLILQFIRLRDKYE
ncbi:MAG: hypothetical protein JWQ66_3356 [Mucilaginibacter sp.]|nr:hypothetical protein [Mucilaginibacter sp.]